MRKRATHTDARQAHTKAIHRGQTPPPSPQVSRFNGRAPALPTHSHVFLRIKEQFFVSQGSESGSGLTIAGAPFGGWRGLLP